MYGHMQIMTTPTYDLAIQRGEHRVEPVKAIPWPMIAPHDRQARINHGQPLEILMGRGGIDAGEAIAILTDATCEAISIRVFSEQDYHARLREMLMVWEREHAL